MTNHPADLAGKVAVVTGSTKGLGRAIAEGFAEAGARVVVSSRKQELCDEVAREISKATGADVLAAACHVGKWDEVPAFVERVVQRFGRIDVLVNNAGISPSFCNVEKITLDFWRKVFSVNLEGALRTSQLVAPIMRDAGGGSIIHIATMGAYQGGGPGNSAYGASKAGLLSLTRCMAMEWAPWKIRVNAISPGPIKSELTEGANRSVPGWYERAGSATMQKRVADTREIIGPALYLASEMSSFVTGEDHLVSGGMLR
jgi:NAD(P)-dependent dehydrogenase (short-subunit alcohol dehydrogenase family)